MAPTALEACARHAHLTVTLGEETYEVHGPASVFIPPGLAHSANVRSGTGFFVAIVLGVHNYDAAFEDR